MNRQSLGYERSGKSGTNPNQWFYEDSQEITGGWKFRGCLQSRFLTNHRDTENAEKGGIREICQVFDLDKCLQADPREISCFGLSQAIIQRVCLTLGFVGILWVLEDSRYYALGQVVGDNTLGAENSQVTSPIPGTFQIERGATRGTNLFHSFSEFSVPSNGVAYFNNAPTIENIFTRITGGTVSNINGTIAANGAANLFLINPNGIIFGPNAKLKINGSFVGSTANSVFFSDGTEFSATNSQSNPILTINVPIGLQLGNNPNPVRVQKSNLEVKPHQNLALIGGEVRLEKGKLTAPGGRIELGGLSTSGIVGLNDNGSLNFPNNVVRSDVFLTNGTSVNVRAGGGGFITINARNLEMSEGSKLIAGIGKNLVPSSAQAGDVEINASNTVSIDGSKVENQVDKNARGNAGDIKITTGSLFLSNKAELNTGTWGMGNSGRVIIKASNSISLIDGQVQSRVNEHAVGNSGGIDITTGNLFIQKSGLSATTHGTGNSGPIIINASGSILMERSDVRSRVAQEGKGNSSGINISAKDLSLTRFTELNADTNGVGNSGAVIIKTTDSVSLRRSTIQSQVNKNAVGNSGGINITTGNLSLTNNTELNAGTWDVGDSGQIIIKANDSISLRDGSIVRSRVNENAVGNSGGIDITTGNLSLVNGGGLSATTDGKGNAGQIITRASGSISLKDNTYISSRVAEHGKGNSGGIYITAKELSLTNEAKLHAFVAEHGVGNSGSIYITAEKLSLTNKAELDASTQGQGNAGSVIINVSDRISLRDGSFVSSRVADSGKGNSGGIYIITDSLSLTNNAELNVSSFGQGNPGNLVIKADSIQLENQGKLTAQTRSGEGGNIVLHVKDILFLRDNSLISAQASGDAKGGNITIDAGFIIALPNQNNDIIASAQRGNGGNINITTQAILGLEERRSTPPNSTNDIDASSEFGLNGSVSINTPDVDPSRGLANLPVEPINLEVAQGCQTAQTQGAIEFFNMGKGGLASNPYEPLSSSEIWEDVPLPKQRTDNAASASVSSAAPANKIVEAQGWLVNEKGEVVLIAEVPTNRFRSRCR